MSNKTIHTSGKRKTAIARATLKKGTGVVRYNGKLLQTVQPKMLRDKLSESFKLTGINDVDVSIKVEGGGITGQTDAARVAISRALVEYKPTVKKVLIDYDRNLLVADVRRKEAAKPNSHGKARAKRQKSYR